MSKPDDKRLVECLAWGVLMIAADGRSWLGCSNEGPVKLFRHREAAQNHADALREHLRDSTRTRVVRLSVSIAIHMSEAARKRAASNKADWIIQPKRRAVRSH